MAFRRVNAYPVFRPGVIHFPCCRPRQTCHQRGQADRADGRFFRAGVSAYRDDQSAALVIFLSGRKFLFSPVNNAVNLSRYDADDGFHPRRVHFEAKESQKFVYMTLSTMTVQTFESSDRVTIIRFKIYGSAVD